MPLSIEERRARNAAYMREYKRRKKAEDPAFFRPAARAERKRAYHRDPEKFKERSRAYRASLPPEVRAENSATAWGWQKKHPRSYILYNARYRARAAGLPFEITVDDIEIPDVCPVLGIPIRAAFGKRNGGDPGSPSLDRIIPALGYVKGNILVISHRANSLKRDSVDPAEHRAVADYIERETARVRAELACGHSRAASDVEAGRALRRG